MLKLASFELHKWASNNDLILNNIPLDEQQLDEIDINKNNSTIKTLGVSYDIKNDCFKIFSPKNENNPCVTKRQILSYICKFYDPMGVGGPLLVKAKAIMQKLWARKLGWDDIVPEDLKQLWEQFQGSLNNMPILKIERHLHFSGALKLELVGYSDASTIAYGCVLYARTIFENKVYSNILCSKSRITPINKDITIPRLELNGALLLANVASRLYTLLSPKINETFLYTDSSIVLCWIKSDAKVLNPYVANRIVKIQELSKNFHWAYCTSKSNPADMLSRGVDPHEFHTKTTWFHGPEHLQKLDFSHNVDSPEIISPMPEVIERQVLTSTNNEKLFFENFSSLIKLQRVVAYMFRFINNIKNKENKSLDNLTPSELDSALKIIIRTEQNNYFSEELKLLKSNSQIRSNIKSLHPFVDKVGLLRVGGRLHNASEIAYEQRHPIILPKNSHVTNLIIKREHLRLNHAGQKQILSSLNMKYWLISGNREIKKNIHCCTVCFRLKAKFSTQLMGSLPEDRVNSGRVFTHVGIDYCGFFNIKQSRIRKSIITKAYIVVFVCFKVKAIHLELVSDMTTETFLAALKRFIFRRGKPSKIYCDNGSTFKGANHELTDLYKLQACKEHKDSVIDYSANEGIEFKFIPSYSPIFGGLWESAVKSTKHHLKRVIGNSTLTYEQFNSVIIEIEGILDSRPISQISNDITDLSYLTPSHFLIGEPITSYPELNHTNTPDNRLKFWQICVKIKQSFWKKWQNDYLTLLQNRPKWHKNEPNLREGMLVILKEDNAPPLKWPMGRITKVIPGKDAKVRVVEVRTQSGTYLRSITKIAVLPIE